jgi:hypothetical protein
MYYTYIHVYTDIRILQCDEGLEISLACSESGMLDDMDLVEQLIDQVYQFSRMYWKSTDQQSLPVTIKYPEMVAQIYPYFQHDKLPDFGKENLWFL